ncbi:MAG: Flp family type IVb pilin [Rhizobiaceae bacterium]
MPTIGAEIFWQRLGLEGSIGDTQMTQIEKFIRNESGATAMEYGIAALLISVVAIMGMGDTGQEVNNLYTDVEGAVGTAADN